jgi:quercetin dioxygenase-like cupin family protein
MNDLKNLPEHPEILADLIDIRPGRVVSMALSQKETARMTLFGFAEGEGVSEETYPCDTFYLVLEGEMPLFRGGQVHRLTAGACEAVPAGTAHAIGGEGPFKLLQISLPG